MLLGHLAEVVLPQPGGPSNRMALGQLLAYFLRVLRAMPSNTCRQARGAQDLEACSHVSREACIWQSACAELPSVQASCCDITAATPAGKICWFAACHCKDRELSCDETSPGSWQCTCDLCICQHWFTPRDASWPAAGCPRSGPSGPRTLHAFGVTSMLHHNSCCMDSTASMQDVAPHVEATHRCPIT